MQAKNTLSVVWRAIGTIRPYPGNPRRITQAAIEKVAASIKAYGWRQPIVVDGAGEILVGHRPGVTVPTGTDEFGMTLITRPGVGSVPRRTAS